MHSRHLCTYQNTLKRKKGKNQKTHDNVSLVFFSSTKLTNIKKGKKKRGTQNTSQQRQVLSRARSLHDHGKVASGRADSAHSGQVSGGAHDLRDELGLGCGDLSHLSSQPLADALVPLQRPQLLAASLQHLLAGLAVALSEEAGPAFSLLNLVAQVFHARLQVNSPDGLLALHFHAAALLVRHHRGCRDGSESRRGVGREEEGRENSYELRHINLFVCVCFDCLGGVLNVLRGFHL